MLIFKAKKILLFLFILLIKTRYIYSADLISIGDMLFEEKRFDESITEYKRFIFFNPESNRKDLAYFKMGLAYRSMGNWHHALDAIGTSIKMTYDSKIADERKLLLAKTMIISKDYNLAKLELFNLINSTQSNPIRQKALYFNGVASIYTYDWDMANKYFDKFYSVSNNENRSRDLNKLLLETNKTYKSPLLAQILSAIMPGAGQFYAENWRNGLNAFLLNGLFIGLTANAIYKKNYDDASLIFLLLTSRYYMGNIYHAGRDAEKYNENLDRQTAEKVLRYILPDEP
jgi:hypothetical protein